MVLELPIDLLEVPLALRGFLHIDPNCHCQNPLWVHRDAHLLWFPLSSTESWIFPIDSLNRQGRGWWVISEDVQFGCPSPSFIDGVFRGEGGVGHLPSPLTLTSPKRENPAHHEGAAMQFWVMKSGGRFVPRESSLDLKGPWCPLPAVAPL